MRALDAYHEMIDDPDVPPRDAAVLALAEAIHALAYQVQYLGNGNASTQMGAIEALGVVYW